PAGTLPSAEHATRNRIGVCDYRADSVDALADAGAQVRLVFDRAETCHPKLYLTTRPGDLIVFFAPLPGRRRWRRASDQRGSDRARHETPRYGSQRMPMSHPISRDGYENRIRQRARP